MPRKAGFFSCDRRPSLASKPYLTGAGRASPTALSMPGRLWQLRAVLPEVGLELDSHRVQHARHHGVKADNDRELDVVMVIEVPHRLTVGFVTHASRGHAFRQLQGRPFRGVELGR